MERPVDRDRELPQLVLRDSGPVVSPTPHLSRLQKSRACGGRVNFSGRQTSCGLPFRAAKARVIRLRHVSSITARSVRYYPSALAVISRHGQRHVALTSGQKLAKSTCESWSFGTNPRAPWACAIA